MTTDEAHACLTAWLDHADPKHVPPEVRAAWAALDAGLRGDAELPEAWARLGAGAAGKRAGKTGNAWNDLVHKKLAPTADGIDRDTGRQWWHPATIDAWRRGEWMRDAAR